MPRPPLPTILAFPSCLTAGISRSASLDALIRPLSRHCGRAAEMAFPGMESLPSNPAGEAPPIPAPENLAPLESYAWAAENLFPPESHARAPEGTAAPAPENLVPPESQVREPESFGGASEFLVGRLPDAARGVPRFYLHRRDDE